MSNLMRIGRRHSRGVSLVEIMVGIVVGLFVLVGLSSVYVNSVRGGRTTTAVNQLSQEMRALMDIMVNDIRRAGYGPPNPFTDDTHAPVVSAGCILYSYDAPDAILPGGDPDFTGFRLATGGVVQVIRPGTLSSTQTVCNQAAWDNLTDEVSTRVDALTFDTVGSKCIAMAVANPASAAHWTVTGSGATHHACTDAAAPGGALPSAADNYFVETRQINITLTASSRTDPTLPPLTLEESVLIRANRVMKP